MTGRFVLVVALDVEPGWEEELDRWYEEEHLPEQRAWPGIRSATRFQLMGGGYGEVTPEYLTLYELDDPEAVLGADYLQRPRSEWARRIAEHWHLRVRAVYGPVRAD